MSYVTARLGGLVRYDGEGRGGFAAEALAVVGEGGKVQQVGVTSAWVQSAGQTAYPSYSWAQNVDVRTNRVRVGASLAACSLVVAARAGGRSLAAVGEGADGLVPVVAGEPVPWLHPLRRPPQPPRWPWRQAGQ